MSFMSCRFFVKPNSREKRTHGGGRGMPMVRAEATAWAVQTRPSLGCGTRSFSVVLHPAFRCSFTPPQLIHTKDFTEV